MPLTKNTTLLYVSEPASHTKVEPGVHLKLAEDEIDLDNVSLNGGVLLKTLLLSSDPYIRYRFRHPSVEMFCPAIKLGDPVDNVGIAKVLRSEQPSVKPGDVVLGYLDFAEYSIYPSAPTHPFKLPLRKLEHHPKLSYSDYLGPLGLPGHTAYSAFKTFMAEPVKTAKTMFISTGAGPVGTFLIEYTKLNAPNVKIIASASTPEKVEIMKQVGADVPFNYKTEDIEKVLKEHGPIDIYFDNVGGSTLDAVLMNMKDAGLIVACGCISSATGDSSVKNFEQIFKRSLTVKGFISYSHEVAPAMATFFEDAVPLVAEGKITSHVHRYNGIKEAAKALCDVHTGANVGKATIFVADE